MAISFLELPIDILYIILYELDPPDLAFVSATCKSIHEIVNDRTVWCESIHRIQRRLPFLIRDRPNILDASVETMKKEGIRQSLLDRRWGKTDEEPAKAIPLDCGENIGFFTVFPGGEWIVIIYRDGRLCLWELRSDGITPRSVTAQFYETAVHGIMHNFWTLRSVDGSAVLAMSQYGGSYSCINFYRISPAEMTIKYLGNKLLPLCRWTSPIRKVFPEEENILACLHVGREPNTMQISLILLSNNSPGSFTCETKAIFDLGVFTPLTDSGLEVDLFSLCIPYTHLIIISHGSCHIRVYEIPPTESLVDQPRTCTLRAPLVYEWNTDHSNPAYEPTLLFPHVPCHSARLQHKSQRFVHALAEDSLSLLCLSISVVREHDHSLNTTFRHVFHTRNRQEQVLGNSYLALRSYRGAWSTSVDSTDRLTFETVAFHHKFDFGSEEYPLSIGSFWVNPGVENPYLVDWDFEEVSGRFCLLVTSPQPPGNHVFMVDRACL